jgi:hypothetical protein
MVFAMLVAILALAMMQGVCPMTLGLGPDGTLFSDRFYGWYKISPKTLENDLKGGCYNDANPHSVTSVRLEVAANTPQPTVEKIIALLSRMGWPRDRVTIGVWSDYPKKPD